MPSLLRASLLGGIDGTITSFVIVSGTHSGSLARNVVLIVGTSSLLADGLSMGVSEYLSSDAERALVRRDGNVLEGVSSLALGFACFSSFVVCGIVPLATYLLTMGSLLVTSLLSLLTLMALGAARTRSTSETLLLGMAQTSLLGAAAGGIAYAVGLLISYTVES